MSPERLAGFDLLELLGEGSSGRVFRARDTASGRLVAVKIPKLHEPHDAAVAGARSALAGLISEVGSGGRGMPRVLGITQTDSMGRFGLVSELLEGRSLDRVLDGVDLTIPGRLASLLLVFEQLAEVVADLHLRGLAHGNLTPANVFLGDGAHRGEVFVLDLVWSRAGLSRLAEDRLPPEMRMGERPRPASDQWLLARVLQAALRGLEGLVPPSLRRAIDRAGSDLLAERFPRIDQLRQAISDARAELTPPLSPLEISPESPTWLLLERSADGSGPIDHAMPLDAASLAPTVESPKVDPPTLPSLPRSEPPERPSILGEAPPSSRRNAALAHPSGSPSASLSIDLAAEAKPPVSPHDPTRPMRVIGGRHRLSKLPLRQLPLIGGPRVASRATLVGLWALAALAAIGAALLITASLGANALRRPTPIPPPPLSDAPPRAAEPIEASSPVRPVVVPESARPSESEPAPAFRRKPPEGDPPAQEPLPSCRPGRTDACRELGASALRAGDAARARRYLERACDARDGPACAQLAELWARGLGGPARARTAESFRRRACALGHAPSCGGRGRRVLDRSEANQ